MINIAIWGVLCGADSWVGIETVIKVKESWADLQTIALNLLKHDKTTSSLKQKRFRAAMDNSFLGQLLTQV
jgi:hypothetical protein